jgi:hypothetical protein
VHDAHHRIFTDPEEQTITDHMFVNWFLPGRLFTDATFVEIATAAFLEKCKDTETPLDLQTPPVLFLISSTEISFLGAKRI